MASHTLLYRSPIIYPQSLALYFMDGLIFIS